MTTQVKSQQKAEIKKMQGHDSVYVEVDVKTKPIYIKEKPDNSIGWDLIISTLVAIISTAIVFYDRIKRSRIAAKIVSFGFSPQATFSGRNLRSEAFSITGQQYFIKLSIQVITKDFFYSDVLVSAKYSDGVILAGKPFWIHPINWSYDTGKFLEISIPKNEFICFNNVFSMNKVTFQYLTFTIETERIDRADEILISFKTPSGKIVKLKPMKIDEIDYMTLLFDRDIIKEK